MSDIFLLLTPPSETGIVKFSTRLTNSVFKRSLSELPIGSEVRIDAVGGEFTLPRGTDQSFVFIAGGIGITPFISMLRYVSEQNIPYKITLIYSNRDRASSAYLDELTDFSKSLPGFNLVLTMTEDGGWQGHKELVDDKFIINNIPDFNSVLFMTAGPPAMVRAITDSLKKLKINRKNIKFENFVGY